MASRWVKVSGQLDNEHIWQPKNTLRLICVLEADVMNAFMKPLDKIHSPIQVRNLRCWMWQVIQVTSVVDAIKRHNDFFV